MQGLASSITDIGRVVANGHSIYFHAQRRQGDPDKDERWQGGRKRSSTPSVTTVVLGGIKIGRKQLFIADVRSCSVCAMRP
jgi:hypothetical protein